MQAQMHNTLFKRPVQFKSDACLCLIITGNETLQHPFLEIEIKLIGIEGQADRRTEASGSVHHQQAAADDVLPRNVTM
jgi:hypothetical protein